MFSAMRSGATALFGRPDKPRPPAARPAGVRVPVLHSTAELEELESRLDDDLSRLARERRKILIELVAARNLGRPGSAPPEVHAKLERQNRRHQTDPVRRNTRHPRFGLQMSCGMDRPELPLRIEFWQPPETSLGWLDLPPAELARELPFESWYALDGAVSGEVWMRASRPEGPARPAVEPGEVCDWLGFVVPRAVQQNWRLSRSYAICRQERARQAWEPFAQEADRLRALPAAQLEMLMVEFGPPPELRAQAWVALWWGGHSMGSLLGLCADPGELDEWVHRQVDKDIPRTFGAHSTLLSTEPGRAGLRRVLLAHAAANGQVGYCQSLNSVAGLLLCLQLSQPQSLAVLISITKQLDGWYTRTMSGIRRDMIVTEKLVEQQLPQLFGAADRLGLPLGLLLSGLMMPLLVEALPSGCLVRLLDGAALIGRKPAGLFGLLLSALLVGLRRAEPSLLAATDLGEFKLALQAGLGAMLNGDAMLAAALHELKALGGLERLTQLQRLAADQILEQEAQAARQEALRTARGSSGLEGPELEALMGRAILLAGDQSGGRLNQQEFGVLLEQLLPGMSDELHLRAFELFGQDGYVEFSGLAACCAGLASDQSVELLFKLHDANQDGFIQQPELRQCLQSTLTRMGHLLPDRELDQLCAHAFSELDRDADGLLSSDEFRQFTTKFPTLGEFLRMQSQQCRAAIGQAAGQHAAAGSNCVLQ